MTEIMKLSRTYGTSASVVPSLSVLRLILILSFLGGGLLWSFSLLTVWHFVFFVLLSAAIYYSYCRYALPLLLYLTMMLLYWVVVPAVQVQTGVGYYTWRSHVPNFGPEALTFALVHILGMLAGFHLRIASRKRRRNGSNRFSWVGICVAFVVLGVMVAIVGYETIILPRRDQANAINQSTYMLFFENVTKLIPALLLAYVVLEGDNTYKREHKIAFVTLLVALMLLVANPVNTGRFISLYGILLVVLSFAIKYSKLRLLAWAVFLVPLYAIVVLGATSMMRSGFDNVSFQGIYTSIQTLEFSSYSIFLDALKVDIFSQGNYLVSHLLIVIPSILWPEKAGSIGIFVAEKSGYIYSNVGLNSFFNAFADYGLLGLFVLSIVFGFLVRNVNPLAETARFRNRRFMYGIILTALSPMIFRGDLSTAMIAFYATVWAYEMTRFLTRFQWRRRVG